MKRYNPGVDSRHQGMQKVETLAIMDEDKKGEYVKYSDIADFAHKGTYLFDGGVSIVGTVGGKEISFLVEADVIKNFSIYNFILSSDDTKKIIKESTSHVFWESPKRCLVAYEPCLHL